MMGFPPYQIAVGAAVLLLALELLTGTFVCLGLGLALFAVAAMEAATGTFAPVRDALLFAALAIALVAALRRAFRSPDDTKRADGDVNQY